MQNMRMRQCDLNVPIAAGILSLSLFGFCGTSASLSLTEGKGGLERLFINARTTHFVAVDGSDNSPGTSDRPWATINHAVELAGPGDTIMVRGGHYLLHAQVRVRNSGRSDAWIVLMGYPGEEPILDAQLIPRSTLVKDGLDNGAFQIEGVSHIRVASLAVINSHDAGFTVRDSSNIDLINDKTNGTFSSGIAVWDTDHNDEKTKKIRILGNTITKATSLDMAPPDLPRGSAAPHEALSVGGAVDFEVAYNHLYNSDKEGIDIKETSKQGKVHHNVVHNVDRQGIYVDAWFGAISDVEIFSNIIHHCRGAGLVLSVENGRSVENVSIHNNLVFDNDGSGLYFSRWGANRVRRNILISNNVFYHNGYGRPKAGQTYYWITGGLYLHSNNLRDITIRNNIFSKNRAFQIGYSDFFLKNYTSWPLIARAQNIQIDGNLIDGHNAIGSAIESGGNPEDRVNIYAVGGTHEVLGNPVFTDLANGDFTPRLGSPAAARRVAIGPYTPGSPSNLWWKRNFPPRLFCARLAVVQKSRPRLSPRNGHVTLATHEQ
jgi:Right handed beta helix region